MNNIVSWAWAHRMRMHKKLFLLVLLCVSYRSRCFCREKGKKMSHHKSLCFFFSLFHLSLCVFCSFRNKKKRKQERKKKKNHSVSSFNGISFFSLCLTLHSTRCVVRSSQNHRNESKIIEIELFDNKLQGEIYFFSPFLSHSPVFLNHLKWKTFPSFFFLSRFSRFSLST